jgi:hypothetical protein
MHYLKFFLFSLPLGFVVTGPLMVRGQSCTSTDVSVIWSDTFDFGGRDDIAYAVAPFNDDGDGIKDDGLVIVGTHQESGENKTQGFIVKRSDSGTEQWRDTVGRLVKDDHFNSVFQASNGKIIVCGWTKVGGGEAVNA